jgi:hypothetical protein
MDNKQTSGTFMIPNLQAHAGVVAQTLRAGIEHNPHLTADERTWLQNDVIGRLEKEAGAARGDTGR